MRIDVQATPRFNLFIEKATLDALVVAGLRHYDAKCRAAAQEGGFARRWQKMAAGGFGSLGFSASWQELDTIMKMCEMEGRNGLLAALYFDCGRALQFAQQNITSLSFDNITPPLVDTHA